MRQHGWQPRKPVPQHSTWSLGIFWRRLWASWKYRAGLKKCRRKWDGGYLSYLVSPPPTEIWSTTYKKCSALVFLNSASDKPGSYGNLKTLGFDSESNRLSFVHQKPLLRLVKRCCHTLLPQSPPRIWVSSPALCPSSPQRAIHTKVLIPGGGLC